MKITFNFRFSKIAFSSILYLYFIETTIVSKLQSFIWKSIVYLRIIFFEIDWWKFLSQMTYVFCFNESIYSISTRKKKILSMKIRFSKFKFRVFFSTITFFSSTLLIESFYAIQIERWTKFLTVISRHRFSRSNIEKVSYTRACVFNLYVMN